MLKFVIIFNEIVLRVSSHLVIVQVPISPSLYDYVANIVLVIHQRLTTLVGLGVSVWWCSI